MKLLEKLFENIEFKGGAAKVALKVIVSMLGVAVAGAFMIGQLKMQKLNKLDEIETLAKKSIEKTEALETKFQNEFNKQNAEIEKIYTVGFKSFEEYSDFNKRQLQLILKYGNKNQDMLSEILELNIQEQKRQLQNEIEKSKMSLTEDEPVDTTKRETQIKVVPLNKKEK